jgi:hypothetical protein
MIQTTDIIAGQRWLWDSPDSSIIVEIIMPHVLYGTRVKLIQKIRGAQNLSEEYKYSFDFREGKYWTYLEGQDAIA